MKRIHYGWLVCLGCALLLFCTSGLAVNAFTIYQPYILTQNGFTNAQSSFLITLRNLFSFLAMFLTGAYYRRLSLRTGMTLAGLLTAAAFCLYGCAHSYGMYAFAAVVLGFGYGFGTMIPIAIILEHWFARKRTLAISLCSAITGLSTLGFPSLLTRSIETRGLGPTFVAEGAGIALLSVATFLLVRDTPASMGLAPFGAGETAAPAARPAAAPSGRGLQRRHWYLMAPTLLLIGAMTNVGYSHLSVLAYAQGFDGATTALAITISGVMMTLSKCVYGWVAEQVGTYRSNWIFGAVLTGGVTLCCVTGSSRPLLYAAMCAYGSGLALTTVGLTAWAGDLSAPEHYDRTVRRFQMGYAGGGLLFSTLPGILADRFGGSYVPAYLFFLGCTVFVVLSVQRIFRSVRT